MALKNPSKLEKLKIKAYKSRNRSEKDLVDTFVAMFNPESFSRKYEIVYGKNQGSNTTDREATYSLSEPSDLNLKLVLDGTGVNQMGIAQIGGQEKVSERVKKFLDLTFRMNGEIHEPNFLKVEWGDLIFSCRLDSVNISYTSFNRDGTPLRAELEVSLISDEAVEKRIKLEDKKSSDLIHSRIVKSGDSLPLLTKEIYGSSRYYLWIAQFNNLDDFRNLTPGQEIFFPPLEQGMVGSQ
ncbi:MAG: hypothetical protein U1F76_09130 [Candidatus Competibacteraceae bacterium]